MMTFLTPGNLIFSSQIPNSTFHSRSQVKIGFLLLKFRLFTPRNRIFSALYSKNSKSQVKIGFFFFSEPKFRFSTPRNLIFFFSEPKVKIGFFLRKFRLFTPRNLIFSAFYSKNRNVKSTFLTLILTVIYANCSGWLVLQSYTLIVQGG